MRVAEGPGPGGAGQESVIHVAVAHPRRLVTPPQVRLHRKRDLDRQVLWNLGPHRQRYEWAALDRAVGATDDLAAIAALAAAVQGRRTTARRLIEVSQARPRATRRRWLESVLTDVAEGTCSVLEHAYLTRVEQAHGLPRGRRQATEQLSGSRVYRDVDYGRVLVELDGRLHHDTATACDRDAQRDLEAALTGRSTVPLSWGRVVERPCSTAATLAQILRRHGWAGSASSCGPECLVTAAPS